MKYYLMVLAACGAMAQSTTNLYVTDLNGRKVQAATQTSTDGERTQITKSINGREVPIEQTERRVVRQDANGTVTETIVRRYDPNGQLASTERTVTEEQTRPGGSTSRSTTSITDVNGRSHQTERKTVETETQGAVTNTQTLVERPSLDGGLEAVEKRSAVIETKGDSSHQDETVYRQNGGGAFQVAERKIADVTHNGNQTTETSALYEPIAEAAKLQLSRQQVTTTTSNPDGSETELVSHYLPSLPGSVASSGAAQQLWEQDTIQRQKAADGSVVETVNIRRADPNHPSKLGPSEQISETVCRGKCSGQ